MALLERVASVESGHSERDYCICFAYVTVALTVMIISSVYVYDSLFIARSGKSHVPAGLQLQHAQPMD